MLLFNYWPDQDSSFFTYYLFCVVFYTSVLLKYCSSKSCPAPRAVGVLLAGISSIVRSGLLKAQPRSNSFLTSPLRLLRKGNERWLSRRNMEWFLSMCLWVQNYPVQVFTSSCVKARNTGPGRICTKLKPKVILAKKSKLLKPFGELKSHFLLIT